MDSESIQPIPTRHLLLQPLDPSDAAEMVDVLADPVLYEFTGGEPPCLEALADLYRSQVRGPSDEAERWYNWIIRWADDQRAIGFVQATVEGGEADVAWLVGAEYQGRGFATEAARAMCDWLVGNGVRQITAHVHPHHLASQKVAHAVRLSATGDMDEDGEEIWSQANVDVFLYGTLMNAAVLAGEFGVESRHARAARLDGFHLTISPRVNIERRADSSIFGSVMCLDAVDVARLYDRLHDEFGIVYEPVKVQAIDGGGMAHMAQVYAAGGIEPAPADPAYVHQLAACVRELGHPEWYAQHIESFLPS